MGQSKCERLSVRPEDKLFPSYVLRELSCLRAKLSVYLEEEIND